MDTETSSGENKTKKRKSEGENTEESKKVFKKHDWKNPNALLRGNRRQWPLLKDIIKIENYARLPADVPTYTNIEAPPSLLPTKKYCDITGNIAPYTDPKTKLRYHNAEVYQFIRHSVSDQQVQKFLALRGAQVILK